MRELAARRLFKVPPCHEGTIHLQTSMSSPGFEPRLNDTAVSVANHYTGWTTHTFTHNIRLRLQQRGMSARHPLLRLPLTRNHR
ncbi:hypothetical protein TNCV_4047861 [Trichonephila clavipes]|nr:hypothetical protein TNCV_4047861 [Trichonephila clavipes]